MKVLIVLAHPEPHSFNHALARAAAETLTAQGHEVRLSDLYAMGFNPLLDRHDFTTVAQPDFFKPQAEQLTAANTDSFARDLAAEQEKLAWADLLILQFPLWWFSLPAIMKGWVDRVFAMGFAYGGGRWYSKGAFRGKRAMLSLTTGGGPHLFSPRGLNGELQQVLFPISHGILYFCGFDVLEPFVAFSPARLDDGGRQALIEAYRERLTHLDRVPLIPFHPLEHYDERLQLKPDFEV